VILSLSDGRRGLRSQVIDSSDVVIQVLDARDPLGTRSQSIEVYMKKEKPWKHLIFVLNKCDLVPTWVTVGRLSRPPALLRRRSNAPPPSEPSDVCVFRKSMSYHIRAACAKSPGNNCKSRVIILFPSDRPQFVVDLKQALACLLTSVDCKSAAVLQGFTF